MSKNIKDIQRFIISYDGQVMKESHSMSVEDLAPALLALDKIFQISNTLLNGHNSNTQLKVVGQRSGSFEVVLGLIQSLPEIMSMVKTSSFKNLIHTLFGATGILVLVKILDKNKIDLKTLNKNQNFNMNGIIIKPTIIQLFDNNNIRKELKEILKPLSKEGIDQLKIFEDKKLLSSINTEEASSFLYQKEEISTRKFVKSYHIVTLTFKKGKWKFSDNNSIINVSIEDKDFVEKVRDSSLSFSKGDILECKVREEQKETNSQLKSTYFIEKVLSHKPSSKQLNLFE